MLEWCVWMKCRDKNVVGKTKSKPLPAIVEKPPKKEEDAVGSVPESQAQVRYPRRLHEYELEICL